MVEEYFIWSNEHNAWWRENKAGYTLSIKQAGIYDENQAHEICQSRVPYADNHIPPEIPVPVWVRERTLTNVRKLP